MFKYSFEEAFEGDIDYAMLQKLYGIYHAASKGEKKYSPATCIGAETNIIHGRPDEKHISTSYVERQNLTMRTGMRRFTRLTNVFRKKLENHCCAISLHFVYYNFVRQHKTLRVTPAMAAGLTKRFMSIEDIIKVPVPKNDLYVIKHNHVRRQFGRILMIRFVGLKILSHMN